MRRWRWQQSPAGELVSEFLGTFVLISFGDGAVAMVVAALNQSKRGMMPFAAEADWLLIAWGWGLAVTFGVYVAGGVSGAHLNPAVTLAQALRRGFAWAKVPGYCAAQILGAFAAAALVYFNYRYAIGGFEKAQHIVRGAATSVPTFSIFATFPAPYFHNWVGPFFSELIGTALLVGLIFAVTDEFNSPVKSNLAPFVVGLIVVAIGISFGADSGYAINPARDFGPRLFAWLQGWKSVALPGDYGNVNSYLWIPIVGPLVGGAIGAVIYDFLVRHVLIARGTPPDPEITEKAETDIEKA
jgi:glycerol uptake facilitator protein